MARPPRSPVITDQDVLGRVAAFIGPGTVRDSGRTLWLLFFDGQGLQLNLIVPVGASPRPRPRR